MYFTLIGLLKGDQKDEGSLSVVTGKDEGSLSVVTGKLATEVAIINVLSYTFKLILLGFHNRELLDRLFVKLAIGQSK